MIADVHRSTRPTYGIAVPVALGRSHPLRLPQELADGLVEHGTADLPVVLV